MGEGLTWVADHPKWIKALVSRFSYDARVDPNELLGEIHERADGVYSTWNGDADRLHSHMRSSLRWYVYKVAKRQLSPNGNVLEPQQYIDAPHLNDYEPRTPPDSATGGVDDFDTVSVLLTTLDDFDASMLLMRFSANMSYRDIAIAIGRSGGSKSRKAVEGYCTAAMQRARKQLQIMMVDTEPYSDGANSIARRSQQSEGCAPSAKGQRATGRRRSAQVPEDSSQRRAVPKVRNTGLSVLLQACVPQREAEGGIDA